MYSTVVNASRQAVRWGSTTGVGTDGTEPRYQDCDGIRKIAQDAGFIGAFDKVTIDHDTGPGSTSYNTSNPGSPFCAVGASTDNTFNPANNNNRISVTVEKQFNPIVPNLVPFISRNIRATSSRTILVSIDIVVTPPVPPKAATTTIINSDVPDPSNVGQSVLVTVTVAGGSTNPTGTVTITGADANCTITLSSSGTGSCNVVFNSPGSRLLNASYGGDSKHLASADADGETHYVRYPTTLAITSHNPDPSTTNQAVTVIISLSSGLPIPNGQTISITGANTNCTITLPATSCNVIFTSTGEKTITATYNPIDPNYHSGPVVATAIHDVLVNKDTVTRITSDSPDPSELNQPVTVSVRVVGLTLPTGTVNITGADTNCSITLSNGTGSCNVVFTSLGARSLVAAYVGNANSNASTSAAAAHTVVVQATTTTITAHTPDPSLIGQSVTVTATVTGGSTTPTGTILITGAATPCTITLPATSCGVVFSSYGTKTLSAVYSGDATHASSNTTATHIVAAPSETPVPSCNAITHGPITLSGDTMNMTVTNPYGFPLTTGPGTVTWHYDKGHKTGSDKSLSLQSIKIGTTTVWTGNSIDVATIPFITPAIIPPNDTVTITFTFHQSYDNYKGIEEIFINLITPGCEGNPIKSY
jgi:hypothetical protein